jgi:hypothetical protein
MIQDIYELLHKRPFQPFVFQSSDGREYAVPSVDHASVNPAKTRVTIYDDADGWALLSLAHIAGVAGKEDADTRS